MDPVSAGGPAPTPGVPPTATPAAAPTTPQLQTGTTIDVTVLRALTAGRFLVALGNTEFVASSEAELKPGTQVRLHVAQASPAGVVLRLAEPVRAEVSAAPQRQAALNLPPGPAAAAVLAAFEEAGAPLDPLRLQAAVRAAALPAAPPRTAQAHALLARAGLPATPALLGVALRAAENRLPDVAAEMGGMRPTTAGTEPARAAGPAPAAANRPDARAVLPIILPDAAEGAPAIQRVLALAGVHPAAEAASTRAEARGPGPAPAPGPAAVLPSPPPGPRASARVEPQPTTGPTLGDTAEPVAPRAGVPSGPLVAKDPPAMPARPAATAEATSPAPAPRPATSLGATSSSSSQAPRPPSPPSAPATALETTESSPAPRPATSLGATSSSSSQAPRPPGSPPAITTSSSPAQAPTAERPLPASQPVLPPTTTAPTRPTPGVLPPAISRQPPAASGQRPSAPEAERRPAAPGPQPATGDEPELVAPRPVPLATSRPDPVNAVRPNLIRELVRLVTAPTAPADGEARPPPAADTAKNMPPPSAPSAPAAVATRPPPPAMPTAPPAPNDPAPAATAPPPPTALDETVTRTVREHLAEQVFKPKDLADYDRVVPLPLSAAQVTTPARLAVASRSTGGGSQATFMRVDAELTRLGPVSIRLSGADSGGPLAITLIASRQAGAALAEELPALVSDLRTGGIEAAVRVVADD